MTWYNSYTGFPYYKHLGDDIETGIDCFNLCRLVFRNELELGIYPIQPQTFVIL